jgi:sensor histidine kinase YesM
MLLNERKLRIYGPLVFGSVLLVFFMLPMFSAFHTYSFIFLRIIAATVLWVVTIWEPTRFVILKVHKKWRSPSETKKRIIITAILIVPVTILIGFLRNQLENYTIWKLPLHDIAFYLSSIGTNLIFVIAEVAIYESLFYIEKWHNSALEAKELKKLNLEMQFDSLKVQIQPHFLFNTLNTLIGLMKMDTPRAIKFTEELARVYRYLLEANERQLISLEEEMKFTTAYFFLLKTRYSEGLHLDIDWNAEPDKFVLPPLSLQILLENAVKHNVITSARPLQIRIQVDPGKKQLTVTNNLQLKNEVARNGKGLAHLKKKFELLNLSGIDIMGNGSIFSVTFPLMEVSEELKENM